MYVIYIIIKYYHVKSATLLFCCIVTCILSILFYFCNYGNYYSEMILCKSMSDVFNPYPAGTESD